MSFLNNSHTILPFLYFSRLQPGKRLLLVTDHPERFGVDFEFFPLSVIFWAPQGINEKLPQGAGFPVYEYGADHALPSVEPFDTILIDLEKSDAPAFLKQLKDLLAPEGEIIFFDWQLSQKTTLQNLPWYLGWGKDKTEVSLKGMQGGELAPQWYFLIEPDLHKPRYMVLPAFGTAIPTQSESPLKRRLIQKGFFYLQPHHRVIVASRKGSDGLAGDVVAELCHKGDPAGFIRKIYISTTNVLLIQAGDEFNNYFIRFPFTKDSIERVKNQQELTALLHRQGIRFIPRPVELKKELPVPCYIEAGMPGRSVEKEFAEGSVENAQSYFQKAQEKVWEIHRQFGRVLLMQDAEFQKYVQPKLDAVANRLEAHQSAREGLKRIGEFLREEFAEKRMLATLVHGDFKIGNCLFDGNGNISGIIDWDMGSRDDLALIDVASLLGRSLRQRQRLSLPDLILRCETIRNEFHPVYRQYFEATETTPVPTFTTLLFYWLDRVYKQINFDAGVKESWIRSNVYPILESIDSILQKSLEYKG